MRSGGSLQQKMAFFSRQSKKTTGASIRDTFTVNGIRGTINEEGETELLQPFGLIEQHRRSWRKGPASSALLQIRPNCSDVEEAILYEKSEEELIPCLRIREGKKKGAER